MDKQLTREEQLVQQGNTYLQMIKDIIVDKQSYPEFTITELWARFQKNNKLLDQVRNTQVQPGKWVQVFSGEQPIFAKVKGFLKGDSKFIVLQGVYNYDENMNRTYNAFEVANCLPVSDELGQQLEFCNSHGKKGIL